MRAAAALFLVLPALLGCTSAPPRVVQRVVQQVPQPARPEVELPYRLVTLENGLTIVMQPDPSMPLVGVEVWTRGGSREEAAGQHGIAHLFEHNLPSSGRFLGNPENRARRAATSRASGAGTEPDFLRFYNNAAPEGLEAMLGSLGDRLESDPAKFNDEAVKRDHDIVISELRRSMGLDWNPEVLKHLHRGTFGEDHPYGHSVQGSEADVRAANAETMREWHRRFAGAANAIVFLVGNFEPARAEQLVRHHFGSIAPGIRTPRATEWIPPARALREVLEKDVAGETVYLRWPVPGWGSADGEYLTLIAHVLNERLATHDAVARVDLYELAGAFTLRGTSEAPLRAELARVLRDGITSAELARVKLRQQTDFVRMLQRPVWRGSRADVLGFGLLFRGDADHYRRLLDEVASATPAVVNDAARRWLGRDGYVLQVVPQGKRTALAAIDRSATIAPASATRLEFPRVESAEANGVRVLKVERNAVPLAQLTFAFDRGTNVDALRASIAQQLANLGAAVDTEDDPDFALLHVSVLSDYANEAASIVSSGAAGFSPP
ncbi:MAG TPA: pitrilysin family protein, partial [Thermoanaerobaculia bacterium]|nr:pitrilysin family protein [Thermoanaerobaculia bacterium]